MSMRDQYGNELLEPIQREKDADHPFWGVYRVEFGVHTAECVKSGMTLFDAKEEKDKLNAGIEPGIGYRFEMYFSRRPNRLNAAKLGPRKR
jgi:hypothetical protein